MVAEAEPVFLIVVAPGVAHCPCRAARAAGAMDEHPMPNALVIPEALDAESRRVIAPGLGIEAPGWIEHGSDIVAAPQRALGKGLAARQPQDDVAERIARRCDMAGHLDLAYPERCAPWSRCHRTGPRFVRGSDCTQIVGAA